jgi:lipopolysaccharide exporter
MKQKSAGAGTTVAHGAALMLLLKLAERSIGLVSTLILARVLTPADFGLVAMAMSVVALTELMGAFGFDVAIIQNQNAQRKHYDTAWTFNVIFSAATATTLLALTFGAAAFYHEPRLQHVVPVLALGALIQGFENVGTVNFRKHMDFRKEFRFLFLKKVASFVVTIVLALVFRSYWALVIGIVSGKLFSVAISYLLHSFRPRFSLEAKAEFFHFSKWLFLSNLVIFVQNKSDSFILGRAVGAYDLGLYNIASEIAVMPSTEFIAPINRAVFPAYSKLSAQLPALRAKFLEVFGLIATVCLPISLGLLCVADSAVAVLLGPQWAAAVPLMRIFAICGLTSALQSNLVLVIVARGQPKANTMMSAGMLVLYLPLLVFAAMNYGVYGAAWVHLVMSVVVLVPLHIVFFRLVELEPSLYASVLWRPVAAGLAMAGAVLWLRQAGDAALAGLPPLMTLLLYMAAGALVYVSVLLLLWRCSGRPAASAEASILGAVIGRFRPASIAAPH